MAGTSLLAITLSLLEKNDEYDELLTACEPVWTAIQSVEEKSKKRLSEYAEWITAAEKLQALNAELDEHQEREVDNIDSFLHDESFIFHTSRNGLAWSLILVVSKVLSRDFNIAATTLNKISPTYASMKWPEKIKQVYSLGSTVHSQHWAMCVRAASNYVRHSEEWRVKTLEKQIVDGKEELVKISTPLVDQLGKDTKPSALSLLALGLPEEELLVHKRDQSFTICEILQLLKKEDISACYYDWNAAVIDYLKSMNGK